MKRSLGLFVIEKFMMLYEQPSKECIQLNLEYLFCSDEDLAKSHEKVNLFYIRLLLIQVGMSFQIVEWIMGCLFLASFKVPTYLSA